MGTRACHVAPWSFDRKTPFPPFVYAGAKKSVPSLAMPTELSDVPNPVKDRQGYGAAPAGDAVAMLPVGCAT